MLNKLNVYIHISICIYILHHPLINQCLKKSGAEFANPRCRICKMKVPNLTGAEFALSTGAEFDPEQ